MEPLKGEKLAASRDDRGEVSCITSFELMMTILLKYLRNENVNWG